MSTLRKEVDDWVHFWPFDDWEIPGGRPAISEVHPSIFRNRYPRENRTGDEQEAYSAARWLRETCEAGHLARYLTPPLTEEERKVAELEGWVLGVG